MPTNSSGKYRVWIRPFRHWWKPLAWIWGALILGVIINDGSSWLMTKSFDVNGTPLGWIIEHLGIMLPFVGALFFLTCIARLAYHQANTPSVPVHQQTVFKLQHRLELIHSLQQEYSSRLAHSLQGRVALELGLHERTDVIASSAGLVFHHKDIATEHPLPPSTSIIQVYDNAKRGLLILGAPGSGKTTLLLPLVIELLQRAENSSDHPLPIILSLSSWAKNKPPLSVWISEQLFLAYGIARRLSTSWIEEDQIMLLLDGLDEVEISARSACIEAINTYRTEHLTPLVICSRSRDYENLPTRLKLPLAVEIQPLTLPYISAYLKQAGKSLAAVRTILRTNTTFQHLITTPLFLMIVMVTYRDKNVKDLPQLGSVEEQTRQTFTHYIQRMLERHQERQALPPARLMRSLIWLAKTMQDQHQTEWYLEWIQPDWFLTKHQLNNYRIFISLLTGLIGALVGGLNGGMVGGIIFGPTGALNGGLSIGLITGVVFGVIGIPKSKHVKIQLVEKFAWSWGKSRVGLLVGVPLGVLFGMLTALLTTLLGGIGGVIPTLRSGFFTGWVGAVIGALIGGLSGISLYADLRLRPNQGIHTSGRNAFRLGIAMLLICGLFGGLDIGVSAALIAGLFYGLFYGLITGLLFGLFFGLIVGLVYGGNTYLRHYVLRFFLMRSGSLPWHAIPLFEEATSYILLQRVGGGYRFIHPLLQEHFATLATSPVVS